ncbi:MAG: hypothetical protein ACON42_04035 [Flavobacteriaceae bacterium]
MSKKIKVFIDFDTKHQFYNRIQYSFDEVFWRINEKMIITRNVNEADIIYGENFNLKDKCLVIVPKLELFSDKYGDPLPFDSKDRIYTQIKNSTLDPIGWIYRFLTLKDEKGVVVSRKDGNKNLRDFPSWKKEISFLPIVEYLCFGILKNLNTLEITSNKTVGFNDYKLLLTHDTDSTNCSDPLELIYDFVKFITRRDLRYFLKLTNSLFYLNKGYRKNPNFGIEKWLTDFGNFKHTFYLSLRNFSKPSLNDVRSSSSDKKYPWKFISSLVNRNVEFGFHPGINAKNDQKCYTNSKNFLEEKSDFSIFGLRHHYWSLNWKNPCLSYRKMVNSGFKYDCSMAFPDHFGLRSGTCLPYRPFDEKYNRPLDIYLIPTSVMDSWILNIDHHENGNLKKMIREIKEFGGIINLDWHTESISENFPYENHIIKLKEFISKNDLNYENSFLPFELIKEWLKKMPNKNILFKYKWKI